LRSIRWDSLGYALSLDLLLALIPLTIMLGMVTTDMDNMLYNVQDTIFGSSMDRVATDTLNTLLETSGDPTDWEQSGKVNVAGLATYDSILGPLEGTIDTNKLIALKASDVSNITGAQYGFLLNITSKTGTNIKSLNNSDISTAKNVFKVERVALYSNLKIVSSAKNLMRFRGGENRTYTNPPNPFQTDTNYLDLYDYYVIVNNSGYDSATVSINNNQVITPNMINKKYDIIKNQINDTFLQNGTDLEDNPVTVWVSSTPGSTMDVFVVQVPKGTPNDDVTLDNVNPQKCKVDLYLWTR
jgi:hypothetical protein